MKDLQVIKNILKAGGEIFFVGGCVRDEIMGVEPKDIDIVVRLIPLNILLSILEQTGKVDLVGESFGVIKYIDNDIELDIALPRKDSLGDGKGHKNILSQVDENISLIDDLIRRDFTFNAIAKTLEGEIIDPFNGVEAIKRKTVSCVDKDAFVEDPLRIVRAVQFALRFGFTIDQLTKELILEHKEKLSEIPGERFLIEFEKIIKKSISSRKISDLLKELSLERIIFGEGFTCKVEMVPKNLSEFLFVLVNLGDKEVYEFIEKKFPLTKVNKRTLSAFIYFHKNCFVNQNDAALKAIHLAKDKNILDSFFVLGKDSVKSWEEAGLPFMVKELDVDGDDMKELFSFKDKMISDALNFLLREVHNGNVKNIREDLIEHLKTKFNYV